MYLRDLDPSLLLGLTVKSCIDEQLGLVTGIQEHWSLDGNYRIYTVVIKWLGGLEGHHSYFGETCTVVESSIPK